MKPGDVARLPLYAVVLGAIWLKEPPPASE